MTAINYLRKLEKEIATVSTATINDSGRRVYEITETALNAITAKYENLIVNQIVNNETRITTYHTYYQVFVKITKEDEAIKNLQKKLGRMLLPR